MGKQLKDFVTYWHQFEDKLDVYPFKLRVTGFIIFYCLLSVLFYLLFVSPTLHQIEQADKQIVSIKKQVKSLENSRKGNSSKEQTEQKELLQELAKLKSKMTSYKKSLLAPEQFPTILKNIVDHQYHLTLLQLNQGEPAQIEMNKQEKAEKSAKTSEKKSSEEKTKMPSMTVYRVPYTIQLEGSYETTMAYLEHLEHLPWRLFWESLSYKVEEYPKASITLQVNALIREKS